MANICQGSLQTRQLTGQGLLPRQGGCQERLLPLEDGLERAVVVVAIVGEGAVVGAAVAAAATAGVWHCGTSASAVVVVGGGLVIVGVVAMATLRVV
eukprot:CAMPEP_0195031326 /NCGR_PEP_ID=MMETSP0326_2-20130528/60974_1 /TAXON_ID=2866 ORGANISM="Crypthecodinium cohnii, Strain Seligo" /NCGR_SAMPLE_ID=MMETSP0326_2 /ASSEMBLY_ACC=CAM_ASM_000348 /LENGTH=96 /DNA_ID=CAMNT_0040054999 /DNA_START=245 /DNA_END=535 /DNA_ORIENTATION=+